jgi:hypothetical protein
MKFYFSGILAAILVLTAPIYNHANAQQGPGYGDLLGQERLNTISTAVPFLLIAPDARAGALGDAGVASSPDANAMHWNPAKFAFIEDDMGFALNYTPWLRALVPDINLSYLSGFRRLDETQTIAFSLVYFSLGEINFTDEVGNFLFPVRPNEFALSVAYARRLGENFSGAITARYIYSNLTQGQYAGSIETKPGMALAADVSGYYERELNWDRTPATFAAGFNISNIGNKISYTDEINADFIPINLRVGPRITFDLDAFNKLSLMVDLNKLLVPTPPIYARDENGSVMIDDNGDYVIESGRDPNRSVPAGMFGSFTDAPGGFQEEINEVTYSAGVEYWYDKQFALRGGYFHEHQSKGNRKYFTVGVGLKYNVFGLDFAYVIPVAQRSPLENVLRFSLHLDFAALAREND